jgi:hypothetical protein
VTQALMSTGAMTFERSALAQARLHELIPGGAHTYARGSDQYPEDMTPILVRGCGARVEDLDGNWLIEYGMGLRSIALGHGYEPAVATVIQELLRRGVLRQSLVISAVHTDADIGKTVEAAAGALEVYARAIDAGSTDGLDIGRPVAPAVREFAKPRRLTTAVTTGTRGAL